MGRLWLGDDPPPGWQLRAVYFRQRILADLASDRARRLSAGLAECLPCSFGRRHASDKKIAPDARFCLAGRMRKAMCGSSGSAHTCSHPPCKTKRKRPARVFFSAMHGGDQTIRGGTRPTRQRADARDQMQDPPRILCRK